MAERKQSQRGKKRERKNVPVGHAHIQSTFNNTLVTITDTTGNVVSWGSAGLAGFKGSRKSTPYAAAQTADLAARRAMDHGMRQVELFLKGSRCYTRKCAFERRSSPPGITMTRRRKVSEFGLQLREKQKVRKSYSVLERQFRNYFEKADQRRGMTGENLLRLLEMRLDNVVFRMGFARSRAEARQLVNHGHFSVNGRPTDVPSYGTRVGDVIEVRDSRRGREYFKVAPETIK